jgi:hypothetical protein
MMVSRNILSNAAPEVCGSASRPVSQSLATVERATGTQLAETSVLDRLSLTPATAPERAR